MGAAIDIFIVSRENCNTPSVGAGSGGIYFILLGMILRQDALIGIYLATFSTAKSLVVHRLDEENIATLSGALGFNDFFHVRVV